MMASKCQIALCVGCVVLWFGPQVLGEDWSEWTRPAEPPQFRAVLPPDEYARRLEAGLKKIDMADVARRPPAVCGFVVEAVAPGSAGEKAGLLTGDIITRIDDVYPWAPYTDWPKTREGEEQGVQVVHLLRKNKAYTFQVPTVPLGLMYAPFYRPLNSYINGKKRNPKWERLIIVGIWFADTDPPLAETAWHHAVKAGYTRDFISEWCGAIIALHTNRPATAGEFAASLVRSDRSKGELVHPHLLYRVALANGWLRAMKTIAERDPHVFVSVDRTHLQRAIDEAKDFDPAGPSPSELAAAMKRADMKNALISQNDAARGSKVTKGLRLEAQTDHFQEIRHQVPGDYPNLDLAVKLRYQPFDDRPPRFRKQANISMVNKLDTLLVDDYKESRRPIFAALGAEIYWMVSVQHGNGAIDMQYRDTAIESDGVKVVTLRIVLVNRRAEMFVNGNRVALLPVHERNKNVTVGIGVCGMKADFDDIIFDKLEK